jgi:hypothetical protein
MYAADMSACSASTLACDARGRFQNGSGASVLALSPFR